MIWGYPPFQDTSIHKPTGDALVVVLHKAPSGAGLVLCVDYHKPSKVACQKPPLIEKQIPHFFPKLKGTILNSSTMFYHHFLRTPGFFPPFSRGEIGIGPAAAKNAPVTTMEETEGCPCAEHSAGVRSPTVLLQRSGKNGQKMLVSSPAKMVS